MQKESPSIYGRVKMGVLGKLGNSSPSYAEEQALKRMTGPYQHTKKSRIGNRKITLFYHQPCELITFVFVRKSTSEPNEWNHNIWLTIDPGK